LHTLTADFAMQNVRTIFFLNREAAGGGEVLSKYLEHDMITSVSIPLALTASSMLLLVTLFEWLMIFLFAPNAIALGKAG